SLESEARTLLADFFRILLGHRSPIQKICTQYRARYESTQGPVSLRRYDVCAGCPRSTVRWSSFPEGFPYLRDGLGIEARCRQFIVCSGSDVRQAAILFEQAGPFDLANADYLIQLRGHKGFAAQLAMECDRKSMGLVTNA